MTGLPTQRRNKMDRVAGAVKGQKRDTQSCTGIPNNEEKKIHYFNQPKDTVLMQRMVKDIKTLLLHF